MRAPTSTIGASRTRRSTARSGPTNYQELDDYLLVGVRFGVRYGAWDTSVFIDNVTDEVPDLGLRVTGDGYRVYTSRPMTAGLRVSTSF